MANKKRTILSIIGIILSVALISSIGLFVKGLQAVQLENVKNTYGSYDLMLTNTNDKLLSQIINNPKVSRYGFYNIGPDIKMQNGLIINYVEATDKALELLPFKIKKGKMPINQNEVAVEEWALGYFNKGAKIGGIIKIDNKDFKLIGILENSILYQSENRVILLTKNNNIPKDKSILLVEITHRTNLRKAVNQLKQLALKEKAKVEENSMLLMMEGAGGVNSGSSGLYVILAVIIGIVLVATIAVIYNAFHISVVERIKQFGLLRAVGTTPRQIRKIVLREATILTAIGVPIGLLFGIAGVIGISTIFKLIGSDTTLAIKLVIDPIVIGISAVVGILSIYISAFLPAYFAGKVSPLAAISSRNAITNEKIKRRKTYFIQKIFGFEGAMAAKNIKRNKKRYRITVFSIVISVALFVTFKSFMDMSLTVTDAPNESRNINFTVYQTGENSQKIDDKLINSIKAIKSVDKVYKSYDTLSFYAAVDKDSEVKEIQSMGNIYKNIEFNGSEKIQLPAYVEVYDSESLNAAKKYLEAGKINENEMNKNNGVIIIKKNTIKDYKTNKKYVGPIANIKVGDGIDLQAIRYDNNTKSIAKFGKGKVDKVRVMAIVSSDPFDFVTESGLKIITTEEVAKKLTLNDLHFSRLDIVLKNVKDEDAAKQSIKSAIMSNPSLSLIDDIDQNRS